MPGDSRGGPLTTDRHPAENSGEKFTAHGTPTRRQRPRPTTVLAMAQSVIGGTGRQRWLLIFRCLLCGAQHVAHGRGDLPQSLERPAACGRGRLCILPVLGRLRGAA